jgi:hypothetical protein
MEGRKRKKEKDGLLVDAEVFNPCQYTNSSHLQALVWRR